MALMSTLTDKFDDGSIDLGVYNKYTTAGGAIAEINGGLQIDLPAWSSGSSPNAGLESLASFDLTNNYVFVEVPQVAQGQYAQTILSVFLTYNDQIMISYDGTSLLSMVIFNAAGSFTHATAPFDYTNHRWWRIRHLFGAIYFDTAPDGKAWTTRYSNSTFFSISSVRLSLQSNFYGPSSKPATAVFDNLNVYKRTMSLTSAASGGGMATIVSEKASYALETNITPRSQATYLSIFQPLPEKDYEYRVFDSSGQYISTWQGVTSKFEYSQTINQNATELTVSIGRSPDNRVVKYDSLTDDNGSVITDSVGDPILLQTETANSVGPDTDVELNYNVDVYTFFGGYEQLLDEFWDPILDNNGDPILVQFGYPNGLRVYSGYIADYKLTYGRRTGVEVVIVPHATSLQHYVYKSGTNTTVTHNSTDPVSMARSAVTDYNSQGGIITWDTVSMPLSGEVSSYTFKLQTTREALDKTVDLLPSGYYHFIDPSENKVYLLEKSASAHHTFLYGKHITSLELRKSITQLKNKVYFVGGDTGAGDLFKYYEDAASIADYRPGLERISDSRVTLDSSASILSNRVISEMSVPRWRTSVTITDAVYDIESIRPGQMVDFGNFANLADDVLLQIVNLNRREHSVTLDLDMVIAGESKRLEDMKRQLLNQEIRDIGNAPS